MSEHSPPIVPFVLAIADQRHPWRLGEIARLRAIYHTATTVRVEPGNSAGGKVATESRQQGHVYCLPSVATWTKVQASRAALQRSIDALADGLRGLGSYAQGLEAAGGIKAAPNPLCPTVISAPDPDHTDEGYWFSGPFPRVERQFVTSHTPKMLRRPYGGGSEDFYTFTQRDHFVCPDDDAWERIQALQRAALDVAEQWRRLLGELGTYTAALADGRYRDHQARAAVAAVGAQIDHILVLAAAQSAPERLPSHPPSWPTLTPPLIYGHHRNATSGGVVHAWRLSPKPRSKARHQAVCAIVQTEAPKAPDWSAGPRLCQDCRRRLITQPQEQSPTKLEEIMAGPTDAFHNLPPKLAGWRWQANGTSAEWHLIAPDGSWQTKDYTYSNRAISEALRRVNSEPKPEPAQGAATPVTPVAPQIVPLSTTAIATSGGTQSRAELHQETVDEYAEAMQAGSRFPPVVVYYDGETYWLADGFHRVAAARQLGQMVEAEVRQGTRRDAVLEACGANANHGLRRTNADKRRAVETLLRDEEWRQWSDREIARRAGVHHELVGRVRTELGLTGGIRQSSDGRTMDTSGIGRANAARAESSPATPADLEAAGITIDSLAIAAAQRILANLTAWDEAEHTRLIQEAYTHARQVRDLERRQAIFAEIDGALDRLNAPAEATPPPLEPRGQRLGPGQPEVAPWPDPPPGWRWNRRGAPAHLIAPDGWKTDNYNVPERALAEAEQHMLNQSTADPYEPSDAEFHAMQARWLAIGYTSFYRSDHGFTTYRQDRGASHCPDWPAVEAAITRKEAEHAAQAAADLAADRQRLQVARTHIEMADQSTLPAQTRQHISDARRLLYFVSDGLAAERTALEQEAARILAELDGRTVPPSRAAAPVRPARPQSADVSAVLAYVTALEAYATELEQLLKAAEPEPIRAVVDDGATFETLLDDLEQMAGTGDLSPEQIASGVRALEQLDDRYNELLSDISHQEAEAYSDRMDRLQALFEQAESQQEATT